MKNLVLAAVVAFGTVGAATAGSYSVPVVEPQVSVEVVEDAAASSGNHDWVGLLMIALVLAAAAN